MKVYNKFCDICSKILSALAVVTIAAMLVIMLIEVVRRYLFGVTFIWSDEMIRILLLYCAFFGGAVAYMNHGLVCFDLLTNKLPRRIQNVLLLVNNIILNIFFIFLIWQTCRKMMSPSVAQSISTATGLPGTFPYMGILIGLIFLTIFTIKFYPELVANLREKEKGELTEKEGDK